MVLGVDVVPPSDPCQLEYLLVAARLSQLPSGLALNEVHFSKQLLARVCAAEQTCNASSMLR